MQDEPFFGLSSYHLLLAAVGAAVILARWLSRLVFTREPAAAPLMILLGAAGASMLPGLPGLPAMPDPRETPLSWKLASGWPSSSPPSRR